MDVALNTLETVNTSRACFAIRLFAEMNGTYYLGITINGLHRDAHKFEATVKGIEQAKHRIQTALNPLQC